MPRFSQQVIGALANPQYGMLTGQAIANVGQRLSEIPANIRETRQLEQKQEAQQALLGAMASGDRAKLQSAVSQYGGYAPTVGATAASQAGDLAALERQQTASSALSEVTALAAEGKTFAEMQPAIAKAINTGATPQNVREAIETGQNTSKGRFGSPVKVSEYDPNKEVVVTVMYQTDNTGQVILGSRQQLGQSEAPPKPKIDVREYEGSFYVFKDGIIQEPPYKTSKAAATEASKLAKSESAIYKAGGVRQSISSAIKMLEGAQQAGFFEKLIGDAPAVGGWLGLLRVFPETDARTLETYINSIKANIGFDQLLTIKDAGSTLGQVSNIENALLQSTIASLDTLTDPAKITEALKKIDGYYNSIIAKEQMGLGADISQWASQVDWKNPDFVRAWEAKGGKVTETEGSTIIKTPDDNYYSFYY